MCDQNFALKRIKFSDILAKNSKNSFLMSLNLRTLSRFKRNIFLLTLLQIKRQKESLSSMVSSFVCSVEKSSTIVGLL